MYVYEGEDYSKCSDEDKKSFDQLLAGIYIFQMHNNFWPLPRPLPVFQSACNIEKLGVAWGKDYVFLCVTLKLWEWPGGQG